MKRLIFFFALILSTCTLVFSQMDTINTGTGGNYTGKNVISSARSGDNLGVALGKTNSNFYQLFAHDVLLDSLVAEIGKTYSAYAAGTAYSLTNSSALLDFGTTDPSITIADTGTYLIMAKANFKLNGATFAGNQTLTTKLRRTNNTAADLDNASDVLTLPIVTTETNSAGVSVIPYVVYTATAGDIVQVWGALSATPSAGSVDCTAATIVAIKISN